jgi:hypothetical protein
MTLATHEFIRRFLIHVLPDGFHRIRYYGLLASASVPTTSREPATARAAITPDRRHQRRHRQPDEPQAPEHPCPCCGGRMIIIEIFARGCSPRYQPTAPV